MSQTAVKLERNGAKPALTARTHSQRMLARTRARLGVTGGPERRQLRVIEGGTAAGHAWFATIMLLTLVGGLLLTLLVNTQLAEGTYERSRLVNESSRLTDRQEALTDELDALRAPASLAKQALSLGMVSAASPAFISLSDGRILGVAEAAMARMSRVPPPREPQPEPGRPPALRPRPMRPGRRRPKRALRQRMPRRAPRPTTRRQRMPQRAPRPTRHLLTPTPPTPLPLAPLPLAPRPLAPRPLTPALLTRSRRAMPQPRNR